MMMNMQKTDESRIAPPQPAPIRLGAVTLGAPVFLAPMAGITNTAFRRLCREYGAGLYVSEMITTRGLFERNATTLRLSTHHESETPRSIQLYGVDPATTEAAVRLLVDEDRADHIDLNFGCPAKEVTGSACGSALMRTPDLAARLMQAAVEATSRPVTVKMRKGWDADHITAVECAKACEQAGAALVAVHARTREQMYTPGIDPEIIARVKDAVKVPVLGNGDIHCAEDALRMVRQTNCDGVMIARGALGDPWLFERVNAAIEGLPAPKVPNLQARMNALRRQVEEMVEQKGEFVAITGRNGCGKTTVTRLRTGLEKPTSGQILYHGKDVTREEPSERSRFIGYVFQQPDRQMFMPTVREEIAFGPYHQGKRGAELEEAVARAIETMLGGRTVTRYKRDAEQYDGIVQTEARGRTTPENIDTIYVRGRNDAMIPLTSLVNVRESVSPRELNHFGQRRSATITANLSSDYSLGQAITFMNETATKVLKPGYTTDLNDTSREFKNSQGALSVVFVLALVFIFLVLAAQFESFIDPLVIMVSVPLSMIGALLALQWSGGSLNVYSQIGLITLVGLITKHGILIVEFTNQLREEGMEMVDALVKASAQRLRPILMTTGAMVLGAVPLALATGAGAETRSQIGWVIVGGMSLGTLLTIFVVPTMYTLFARKAVPGAKTTVAVDSATPHADGPAGSAPAHG